MKAHLINKSLYLLHQQWCDQAIIIKEVMTLHIYTPFDVPCTIWTVPTVTNPTHFYLPPVTKPPALK